MDGLGHERRVQTVLLRDGLERKLEGHRVVRGLERVRVLEVDLVLALGHLVMRGLDADPERLERIHHVLTDLLREVGREVEVARLVVGQRRDLAQLVAPEQEELELGSGVDDEAQLPRALRSGAAGRSADHRRTAHRAA